MEKASVAAFSLRAIRVIRGPAIPLVRTFQGAATLYAVTVIEFSFRTRRQNLERMAGEDFDLLVIGGGIHGAGVARDAALRGLKVALVEKGDFASGTSSKSSKLIHGGLRYLERFEFGLVRESCRERRILQEIAPHLVKPLQFLIPIYKGDPRPPWMVGLGMTLYDLLSMPHSLSRHRMLSAEEALLAEPALKRDGLMGAAEYWDCQENDARFCLANVVDAAKHDAVCANYLEVVEFGNYKRSEHRTPNFQRSTSNQIEFVTVRDRIGNQEFDIRSKAFVNAGGPWVDRIASLEKSSPPIPLRPTKGIHLVTRRLTNLHALLLQARRDRRVFFVLPWGAGHSLIGTTDTDFSGNPDRVEAEPQDVGYLLEEANRALPSVNLSERDVLSTFAGLRPLLHRPGRTPSDVTRRHKLTISPSGLISIVGGKFTTYRAVAEGVVDLVCKRVAGSVPPCRTAREPLAPEFPAEVVSAEIQTGRGAEAVPTSTSSTSNIVYAVRHAVNHEMVMMVGDFLFRRTTLGYTEANVERTAQQVADEMRKLLSWTENEKARQMRSAV